MLLRKSSAVGALISLYITSLVASAEPTHSGNPFAIEVAERYLEAYTALDIVALEELYAEDAVFIDPTSFDVPQIAQPVHFIGKDNVLAFVASLDGVMLDASYELDRIYEASGEVVFIGDGVFTFASEPKPVSYRSAVVTIISVKDGQVIQHRDYADYAGLQLLEKGGAQ